MILKAYQPLSTPFQHWPKTANTEAGIRVKGGDAGWCASKSKQGGGW